MFVRPALALALSCLPLAGCAAVAVGAAGAVGVTSVQDRSLGQAVDDATASNQIKAKLLAEGGLGEVDVEVADGLVLLSGRVSTPEQRVRAESLAWTSVLTQDVANEIQIERPGGFLTNLSDEVITARVRSALIGSSTVKSINFNIETYDGVVYLMGVARSQEELVHAAEKAANVGGVQQVVSYVRVLDPAPIARRGPSVPGDAPEYTDAERDLLGGNY